MKTEVIIEFDKIKKTWSDIAVTAFAKEKIDKTVPFLSETELRKNMRDTTESRIMIEKCGTPPLAGMDGAEEILESAENGDCLSPDRLEKVQGILTAVKRLKEYLTRGRQYQNTIAYYDENLCELNELRDTIGVQIRNGAVDDYASKLLLQLRNDIEHEELRMKEKADAVMRANKECMADSFSTLRNGRICIPVKKEYKFKISGNIIDKSATGNTLFIEPAPVAKHYETLSLLRIDEENEVHRILYTLTAMVADVSGIIRENIRMIEKLDFIFSKGKLSIDMDASEPEINTERRISLSAARHPLMNREINVPLNFEIGGDINGIVITGPNTGGKTVAIKTVALNSIMAQCGLHVTCRRADICMNSNFLCDIGDGQNLSENLSTFSAHISNVLKILEEVNRDSLVIMDELGSGTDPAEGMGIATAILEELRKSGCLFLVTTHYPEIKNYAEKTPGIENARMTFDRESLKPTYKMIRGEAGESCAFYIAERLGMPREMLMTAARAVYGNMAEEYLPETSKTVCTQEKATSGRNSGQARIQKAKTVVTTNNLSRKFSIGDSVMVFPEKKIGIVCKTVNEQGLLRVQMPHGKIWINHKRVKLHVPASQLYPEDYDFSIIFDSVEERKLRHDMSRKYTEGEIVCEE